MPLFAAVRAFLALWFGFAAGFILIMLRLDNALLNAVLVVAAAAVGLFAPLLIIKARAKDRVEADLSQREPDLHAWKRPHLAREVLAAVVELSRCRPVARRSAARRGGDEHPVELEPVVGAQRVRPAREPLAAR